MYTNYYKLEMVKLYSCLNYFDNVCNYGDGYYGGGTDDYVNYNGDDNCAD